MTFTILSENTPNPADIGLMAEHGLSIHISLNEYSILFDFGPRGTLVTNSDKLGIRLQDVKMAVLSHGHYDHAGDLDVFLRLNKKATVYHGKDAFVPKWSISEGSPKEVGIPFTPDSDVADRLSVVNKRDDRNDFIILTAAPGHGLRPKGNNPLLMGPTGERLQDDFVDEITLVVRGEKGLVVLTGCSHRGILNIVDQVRTYCPDCPINALIGGFHLTDKDETEENLMSTCTRLAESLPESRIYSGHCTEKNADKALKELFQDRYEPLYVGKVMTF
jgi:7,8-dihydropterin-6-yl-methyl-4-(beta-D-ribofuranosyl)aminobenzene 5'-phosphate synthase